MKRLKIVLLGGGSLYFECVMAEIGRTPELHGSEIVLYDINAKRMALMARVGVRIAEATRSGLKIGATLDLKKALDGADYAIASIGVHGSRAEWHKADCAAAAKFGIIHTTGDTVGPAGLSQGLNIIPVFVDIAKKMERYCPDAILLNHSNPMAPICRAVDKYSSIHVIGYCHNVAGDIDYFAKVLGVSPEQLETTIAGVNHCGWLLRIAHKGKDVYPELKKRLLSRPAPPKHIFAQEVLEMFDLFPIGGDRHIIEFFPHSRRAEGTKNIHYGLQWRMDMIRKNLLKKEISKQPADIELKAAGKKAVWLPDKPTPESLGEQIKAMAFGPEILHYVNTPNRNAIANFPDWAVVEMKAMIGKNGASPVYVGEMPPQAARWSLAQIYAHELTVDAAVEKSRKKAIMALACDPMIRDFEEARKVFDAMVKAQGDRLKRFRRGGNSA